MQLVCDGEAVSIEDSSVIRYARWADRVVVELRLWDDRLVEVCFVHVVGVCEVLAGDVSHVRRQVVDACRDDVFAAESISQYYGTLNGAVIVFEFVDPEDRVVLRIASTAEDAAPSVRWICNAK